MQWSDWTFEYVYDVEVIGTLVQQSVTISLMV